MSPRRRSWVGDFWTVSETHEPDRAALVQVWDEGSCTTVDPEFFFPLPSGDPDPALKVCASCPVQELCLATFGPTVPHGVVGGMTEDQRRRYLASDHPGTAA